MINDSIEESNYGVDEWLNDAMTGNLTGGLMTITDAAMNAIADQTRQMAGAIVDYRELLRI